VLIGILLLLGDLGVIVGLVLAVVLSALRLRASRLARPGVSAPERWAARGHHRKFELYLDAYD